MNITVPPYKYISQEKENLKFHFHPDHWADLMKSHLQLTTIWDANVFSCPPTRIAQILGSNPVNIRSAIAFPYYGIDFSRLKIFPCLQNSDGHKIKYLQRKGSTNHLYFCPNFFERLTDPRERIFICEGEKKALRADQEGLCAIGISGIFGWARKGRKDLIEEFDLVLWNQREVRLIPDGDWISNSNVKRGTLQLGHELRRRGAKVKVIDVRGLYGK